MLLQPSQIISRRSTSQGVRDACTGAAAQPTDARKFTTPCQRLNSENLIRCCNFPLQFSARKNIHFFATFFEHKCCHNKGTPLKSASQLILRGWFCLAKTTCFLPRKIKQTIQEFSTQNVRPLCPEIQNVLITTHAAPATADDSIRAGFPIQFTSTRQQNHHNRSAKR